MDEDKYEIKVATSNVTATVQVIQFIALLDHSKNSIAITP